VVAASQDFGGVEKPSKIADAGFRNHRREYLKKKTKTTY